MKLLGKLEQLVELVFRKGAYIFTVKPNQSTVFTDNRTYELPPGDLNQELVSSSSSQILTNKTISGASNTLSSIPNSATTATSSNTLSTIVARDASGNFAAGTITAAFSGNLTGNVTGDVSGTAANITATTNSTLTTLSSLSLPGSQVTGNIAGTASNITATSNSTLTTLSSLSLPASQVTGNISGNAANVTGIVATANGGTGLNSTATFPNSGTVVTRDASETLLNKQISSTSLITGALNVPAGLQSERPGTPVNGMIRYNTSLSSFEGYANNDWGGLASAGGLPPGTMIDYAGTVEPSGWLLCDGRALDRTTYAGLFTVIGTAYGAGNGSTTFNIPDFRGRFARYTDNMGTAAGAAGRDVGRVLGASQTQTTAKNGLTNSSSSVTASGTTGTAGAHSHTYNEPSTAILTTFSSGMTINLRSSISSSTSTEPAHSHPVTVTGTASAQTITGDAETRPINLSCNKLIKI